MMELITVTELLSRIKRERENLKCLYTEYINPETSFSSKCMINLYNPNTNLTVSGMNIDDTIAYITNIDNSIKKSFTHLQRLLMIKEQVNATSKITINSPFEEDKKITLTIAQVLTLKSDTMRNILLEYSNKLKSDLDYAKSALSKHQKFVLHQDKVNAYVNAKLQSLAPGAEAKYLDIAQEYFEANKLEMLDPLDIINTIDSRRRRVIEFYDIIDIRLSEFNAHTKIWIDLDNDQEFWGYR